MRFEHVQRVCECIVRGEKKKGIFSNERFSSEDCRKPDTAGVIAPEEEERKKRGGGGGEKSHHHGPDRVLFTGGNYCCIILCVSTDAERDLGVADVRMFDSGLSYDVDGMTYGRSALATCTVIVSCMAAIIFYYTNDW